MEKIYVELRKGKTFPLPLNIKSSGYIDISYQQRKCKNVSSARGKSIREFEALPSRWRGGEVPRDAGTLLDYAPSLLTSQPSHSPHPPLQYT